MLVLSNRRPHGPRSCSSGLPLQFVEQLKVAGPRADERAEEAEAACRRLTFLLKTSQQLAASLEPSGVLQSLVEQAVPELGDAAIVHIVEADRRERRAAMATSPALGPRPREWWDEVERVTRQGVQQARRTGTSRCRSKNHKPVRPSGCDCGELVYLRVPLRARGRTLGTLTVLPLPGSRTYGPEDLAVAEALGSQAGLALDNARQYDEQRRTVQRQVEVRDQLDAAQSASLRKAERERIARELHDHVEQTFFAIGLTATAALENGERTASDARLADALLRVGDLSNRGAEQIRAAIFELNHAEFAGHGLTQALWKLVRSFQQRTGVDTDLLLSGSQRPMAAEVAEALYATASEALANVERHARAGAVVLGLHVSPRAITLTVHDDGDGAPNLVLKGIGSSATHFGLRGLRERVRRLRGTFSSRSGPAGGFVVRARIPLQAGCGA